MSRWVCSAFALGMAPARCRLIVEPVESEIVRAALDGGAESAVGHASTAEAYTALLGRWVACNRRALALVPGDAAFVGARVALAAPDSLRGGFDSTRHGSLSC